MARAIDADELEMFPYSEGSGTEEQIAEWIEQAGLSEEDTADRARLLCWKVIKGCINVVKTQPTLSPPNEPLTQADLDGMDYDKVWIDYEDGTGEWALVCNGYIYSIDTLEGAGLDFVDYMRGEKLEPHGYKVYRRPPEVEKAEHKAKCAKCGQEKEIACTVDGEPWCEDCFDRAMG